MTPSRWLPLKEAAKSVGIPPRDLREIDELRPHIRQITDRRWVIDREAWDAFLEDRRLAPRE